MKLKETVLAFIFAATFGSCQKMGMVKTTNNRGTRNLVVPTGFDWQSSRKIRFTVDVTDKQFGKAIYLISIYDGDPASGGKLLSKGSARINSSFITTIDLANRISKVFLVKTSQDNRQVMISENVGNSEIKTSIGAKIMLPGQRTGNPEIARPQ